MWGFVCKKTICLIFLQTGDYKHLGQSLAPAIMQNILVHNLSGKHFNRRDAIELEKIHLVMMI